MKEKYTLEADGFCGVWFEGKNHRDKAIIYMSGAGCDEKVAVDSSTYLRETGYSVLCLGFYLWEGMPKELYKIPVEYVEAAVKELKKNGYDKIAIHGISTGAGYALLCASLIPDISCIIAVSPYDYVMEGMKNSAFPQGFAVYSHQSESLHYSRYTCLNQGLFQALKAFFRCKKQKGYKICQIMRYAYDTSEESEASRIKVENIHGNLLLLAPDYDDCWPSEKAVPRMERILKEKNHPYQVKTVIYEKASHFLGADMKHMQSSPVMKMMLEMMLPVEKKHPIECQKARKDSMQQILEFLDAWE